MKRPRPSEHRNQGPIGGVPQLEALSGGLSPEDLVVPRYGCSWCGWSGLEYECGQVHGTLVCPWRHTDRLSAIGFTCRNCSGFWSGIGAALDHTCISPVVFADVESEVEELHGYLDALGIPRVAPDDPGEMRLTLRVRVELLAADAGQRRR
jgi:hypothetical protein